MCEIEFRPFLLLLLTSGFIDAEVKKVIASKEYFQKETSFRKAEEILK